MRPRDGLAEIEDPIEIAATWGDLFFSGDVPALDWLTMRTCTVDLSGTTSQASPLDREGMCSYAQALDDAFEGVAWRVGRVEQREHEVRLDASLEARHTGPLDLSFRDGPTYPGTGRRIRLPFQRFTWTIAHKRVLAFEVERGPGLGMDFLARELELTGPVVEADKRATGSAGHENGDGGAARQPNARLRRSAKTAGAKPSIEDLIREAEASRRQRVDDGPGA